jgi:hypothetical protein
MPEKPPEGLSPEELAEEQATDLPERDALSVVTLFPTPLQGAPAPPEAPLTPEQLPPT